LNISILLPTRENIKFLEKAINSILKNAYNPKKIEILLAVDDNDRKTIEYTQKFRNKNNFKCLILKQGEGYFDAGIRLNELAKISKGDLLFCFCDDMVIKTKNWDKILLNTANRLNKDKVFTLYPIHNQSNKNWPITPIITREWYNIVGKFCNSFEADTEILIIGKLLKRIYKIKKINIFHFNDLSKKIKQKSWKNTRYKLIKYNLKHHKSIFSFKKLFSALIDYDKLNYRINRKNYYSIFKLKLIIFFPFHLISIKKNIKLNYFFILFFNFFQKKFSQVK